MAKSKLTWTGRVWQSWVISKDLTTGHDVSPDQYCNIFPMFGSRDVLLQSGK